MKLKCGIFTSSQQTSSYSQHCKDLASMNCLLDSVIVYILILLMDSTNSKYVFRGIRNRIAVGKAIVNRSVTSLAVNVHQRLV
jgi:hypothetical protein